MMNIAVVGLGYVGISNALVLAQHHQVIAVEINEQKVADLNQGVLPIDEEYAQLFLDNKRLHIRATQDLCLALRNADYVVIATPTNYDEKTHYFDTQSVEAIIEKVNAICSSAKVVIKSTVPVGFTQEMAKRYPNLTLLFSPEFLREGSALYDNLNPSRIVVGGEPRCAREYSMLMQQGAEVDADVFIVGFAEAEAIKLFANTFLALRVSFFNELDTYAMQNKLNPRHIIEGVCADPRIGSYYNNPSFGYGGYCLPKDTKQLLANYADIPQDLIRAVVQANKTRKDFISEEIIKLKPSVVGVYRLAMKSGADNFRSSSILSIAKRLHLAGIKVVVFEPSINEQHYCGMPVYSNLEVFKRDADVILANRDHSDLSNVKAKVYSRDLFGYS